ncbi:MAG: glycosyltransferase family 4 protein [Chloroflexi bacterium]|nr:glycosyltransferase family 4 protein [Chloroflexota bacterium]
MNILLISLWYYPEPVGKPHDLAVELVKRGYRVTVITGFPNYPSGHLYPGYRTRLAKRETIDGVNVIRLAHVIDRSRSAFRRLMSYTSFSLTAMIGGSLLVERPDLIWTYQIGLPGIGISLMKRAPWIHEVQDLWPDWGRTTTKGLNGWLNTVLAAQERFIYRRATVLTTISEGFKRVLMSRAVPEHKIELIPNWANDQDFLPTQRDPDLGAREGLVDRINIIYGGNIGTAQGLGVVLDAASLLQDLPQVQFVIIGDGIERESLSARAEKLGISNVRFLGSRPPEQTARYFAFADLLFLHLARDPHYEITVPSKTYAYMASGRPILAAASGVVADLIQETGAGIVCRPDDPAAIAKAVRDFLSLPAARRAEMGDAGRNKYLTSFTRARLVPLYEILFQKLLASRTTK